MFVLDVRDVKNGYIRFSVECEGIIISGFRTTKILNVVLPPEGSYHGRPFHFIKLPSSVEIELLRQVKEALNPKPIVKPNEKVFCADCGGWFDASVHPPDYHNVAKVG